MSGTTDSGKKIFDVIEKLFSSPSSAKEISDYLNQKGIKARKNNAHKYIRTLNHAGFDIRKENGRYHIFNTPYKHKIPKENEAGLRALLKLLYVMFGNKNEEANILKEKLLNMFGLNPKDYNFKGLKVFYNKAAISNIALIKKFFDDEIFNLIVTYNKKWYRVKAKEIQFGINGAFLYCDNKTDKDLNLFRIEKISKIKPAKKTKRPIAEEETQGTVFKLTGTLKSNYILRKGESARYYDDKIIVTNTLENKKELFNRLIKYGANCEVILPESDREEFKRKIQRLLRYYKSM